VSSPKCDEKVYKLVDALSRAATPVPLTPDTTRLGVGDVEEVVLRDRRMLADDGMVVLIVTIDRRSGRVMKNPDIISRGFICLREHQELLKEIRHRIRGIVGRIPRSKNVDADYLKSLFRDQIGQFIYHKTQRRPMILPVVIEI